jgi:uncharacterized protein YecE (DUF72 family)
MSSSADIRIGTAGWSIPHASAARFTSDGTHLQRYSHWFHCAEINSSFHRPHAVQTYARWRESTPPGFRFAVKVPRTITHELKLAHAREPLAEFLGQSEGLGEKRGPILVQLPPSLAFDASIVSRFFDDVREQYDGPLVCEPRHETWFSSQVASVLANHRIARVAADPPPVAAAAVPGGWPDLAYFRLHGSPRKYWSRYGESDIALLEVTLGGLSTAAEIWCVFDNTASGAALENAWELRELVNGDSLS